MEHKKIRKMWDGIVPKRSSPSHGLSCGRWSEHVIVVGPLAGLLVVWWRGGGGVGGGDGITVH